jgi:hypothetical protein
MASENGKKTDWLTGHLAFLRGLKSPNDNQKLLILLADKKGKTPKDERTFAMLVKSERALDRAKKAQAEVSSLLANEKKKVAAAERTSRTHKLIQLGLLFGFAELDESPRDFLMGLLLAGARMDGINRQKMSRDGADFLAKKEPKKEQSVAQPAQASPSSVAS